MKTLALLLALALAGCGGGGEDSAGWCDLGDECPPEREQTSMLFDEFGDYRSVPSPSVCDYIVHAMTLGSVVSTIGN